MNDKEAYATMDYGGLLRCCAASVPVDARSRILAGTEGEVRPCQFHDGDGSGVRFVRGVWRAAWIKDGE